MIANFYIIPESFIYNNDSSIEEIQDKIESLSIDYNLIVNKYKDSNNFYINNTIYEINLFKDLTIVDILYNDENKKILDSEVRLKFQLMIDKSKECDLNFSQIVDLLEIENEEQSNGVIAFNKIEGLKESNQIIYNLNNWILFRRDLLGKYPKDPDFFITEAEKYFPKLYFHEKTKKSIKEILKDYPKKIIFHLDALNDKFCEIRQDVLQKNTSAHRQTVLEHFSKTCSLDEIASLEGGGTKHHLEFDFKNDNTEEVKTVCCEPHLKLPYKDKDDGKYSTDQRIYFHEGIENFASNKILIGHIGGHL